MEKIIAEHLKNYNKIFYLLYYFPTFKVKDDSRAENLLLTLKSDSSIYTFYSPEFFYIEEEIKNQNYNLRSFYSFYTKEYSISFLDYKYKNDFNITLIANSYLSYKLKNDKIKIFRNIQGVIELIVATVNKQMMTFLFDVQNIDNSRLNFYRINYDFQLLYDENHLKNMMDNEDYLLYFDYQNKINYFSIENYYKFFPRNSLIDQIELIKKNPTNYNLYKELFYGKNYT